MAFCRLETKLEAKKKEMCQINTCLMDRAVESLTRGGECAGRGRHKGLTEDGSCKTSGWGAEETGGEKKKFKRTKNVQLSVSLWAFVYSAPGSFLHESWLLSSLVRGERRGGMPVSLSTYYRSGWEIWSTFLSGCPPGLHISHLLHLFMIVLWPQKYAMPPRDGGGVILNPDVWLTEKRKINLRRIDALRLTAAAFTLLPLCFLSAEFRHHSQRWRSSSGGCWLANHSHGHCEWACCFLFQCKAITKCQKV